MRWFRALKPIFHKSFAGCTLSIGDKAVWMNHRFYTQNDWFGYPFMLTIIERWVADGSLEEIK